MATSAASAFLEPGVQVGTVESPTWEKVGNVEASLDDDQRLVTPEEDCVAECESNCPCKV